MTDSRSSRSGPEADSKPDSAGKPPATPPAKLTAEEAGTAPTEEAGSGSYHHGNLRDALLDAVGQTLAEKGTAGLSLREAARRAGVSHGAPAHHFGDKLGMLTAFSARGFERFGSRLRAAADGARSPSEKLVAAGVEYVRFAVEERAYFEVMFRNDLHDATDPHFEATSQAAFSVLMELASELTGYGQATDDALRTAIRAWSTAHGLATLWLDGTLGHFWNDDIYELAARVFTDELAGGSSQTGPAGVPTDGPKPGTDG